MAWSLGTPGLGPSSARVALISVEGCIGCARKEQNVTGQIRTHFVFHQLSRDLKINSNGVLPQ